MIIFHLNIIFSNIYDYFFLNTLNIYFRKFFKYILSYVIEIIIEIHISNSFIELRAQRVNFKILHQIQLMLVISNLFIINFLIEFGRYSNSLRIQKQIKKRRSSQIEKIKIALKLPTNRATIVIKHVSRCSRQK